MLTQQIIAYSIIAVIVTAAVPITIVKLRQRKREKLRRRGIKTYEHRRAA